MGAVERRAPRRHHDAYLPTVRPRRLRRRQGERLPDPAAGGRGLSRRTRAPDDLKIAIVRQRYNPYGGAERFVSRAVPALERAGDEVTLICRRTEGWGARRTLRIDPFYVGNLWRDRSFASAARGAWRCEGFDVVQS